MLSLKSFLRTNMLLDMILSMNLGLLISTRNSHCSIIRTNLIRNTYSQCFKELISKLDRMIMKKLSFLNLLSFLIHSLCLVPLLPILALIKLQVDKNMLTGKLLMITFIAVKHLLQFVIQENLLLTRKIFAKNSTLRKHK